MTSPPTVPLIIAHRGGAPDHPDNSWAAFEHAIQNDIRFLECDVQPTRDGHLVVFHDDTVFKVPVSQLSLDQLRALVADILTFDAFVEKLDSIDPAVRLVIDLKGGGTDRYLMPYLEDARLRRRSLITSKHSPSLRRIRQRHRDVRLGLSRGATLTVSMPDAVRTQWTRIMMLFVATVGVVQARWAGARFMALQYQILSDRLIRWLHRFGMRVDAWTVDDPDIARSLAEAGVDMITSNVPVKIHRDRPDDLV